MTFSWFMPNLAASKTGRGTSHMRSTGKNISTRTMPASSRIQAVAISWTTLRVLAVLPRAIRHTRSWESLGTGDTAEREWIN